MTVPGWWHLVDAMPGHDRRLKVLVLGDPAAQICQTVAAAGHAVSCCPDLQSVRGAASHVEVWRPRVQDLLVEAAADIDVVVAVDGWQRLRRANTTATFAALLEWMRAHATVSVVEAPRRVLAPDLNDLGPFSVLPEMGAFAFLAEATSSGPLPASPVVLASDHALLAAGEWIPAAAVTWVDEDAPDARTKPVRTYLVPDGLVVKVECTSEDYFERAQVVGEAAFLASVDERRRAVLGLPRVHSLVRGRAVATLVRSEVPAEPAPDLATQVDGVLDVAADYAAEGIFHNDVRPWNVMWEGCTARLIDFADTSTHDDDVRDLPQVLALAGTLAAIATDEIRAGEAFHGDVLDLAWRGGLLERWPLAQQLTGPWLSLRDRRAAIDFRSGATAVDVMRCVLEVTCA